MFGAIWANIWPNISLVLPTALEGVIWGGMEMSGKAGRDKGGLISTFACFSAAGVWFLGGGGGVWALGYVSAQIWDFPNISLFAKIWILKSFDNSRDVAQTKFAIIDIKFRFTCG